MSSCAPPRWSPALVAGRRLSPLGPFRLLPLGGIGKSTRFAWVLPPSGVDGVCSFSRPPCAERVLLLRLSPIFLRLLSPMPLKTGGKLLRPPPLVGSGTVAWSGSSATPGGSVAVATVLSAPTPCCEQLRPPLRPSGPSEVFAATDASSSALPPAPSIGPACVAGHSVDEWSPPSTTSRREAVADVGPDVSALCGPAASLRAEGPFGWIPPDPPAVPCATSSPLPSALVARLEAGSEAEQLAPRCTDEAPLPPLAACLAPHAPPAVVTGGMGAVGAGGRLVTEPPRARHAVRTQTVSLTPAPRGNAKRKARAEPAGARPTQRMRQLLMHSFVTNTQTPNTQHEPHGPATLSATARARIGLRKRRRPEHSARSSSAASHSAMLLEREPKKPRTMQTQPLTINSTRRATAPPKGTKCLGSNFPT